MAELTPSQLEAYLCGLLGRGVVCREVSMLVNVEDDPEKGYGYGEQWEVEYEQHGEIRRAVFHTIKPGPFGHETMADRAALLLGSHHGFNSLPNHARSLDVGGIDQRGTLMSLGRLNEVFLLTEYVEGSPYVGDLMRLADGGTLLQQDLDRADALCDCLLEIHSVKGTEPGLYERRIRETVGHNECIMGVIDCYPCDDPVMTPEVLLSVERCMVDWRWRLRGRSHRLARVHGDYHPSNILFREGSAFSLIDRSRGDWGEPADDVTALTLNYVFRALVGTGRFEGPLAELWERFWRRYLRASGDQELLEVVAPFLVWRALVIASPVWHPNLAQEPRRRLLSLMQATVDAHAFEPDRIGEYLGS